jgi:RNase P subunit RPR2
MVGGIPEHITPVMCKKCDERMVKKRNYWSHPNGHIYWECEKCGSKKY